MSHHDPAFTLLIFPSSETWQHRASAFPILSTSLATAATISYTPCSPPYPNSILLLHSFCHFYDNCGQGFLFEFWLYCHTGQTTNTAECIFSVQYDPFQNTITITVSFVVQRKISFTSKFCEDGSKSCTKFTPPKGKITHYSRLFQHLDIICKTMQYLTTQNTTHSPLH
jgi:hypothetical protein